MSAVAWLLVILTCVLFVVWFGMMLYGAVDITNRQREAWREMNDQLKRGSS